MRVHPLLLPEQVAATALRVFGEEPALVVVEATRWIGLAQPDTGCCVPGASGVPPHTARNAVHVAVDVNSHPATTATVLDSDPL